MPDRDAPPSPPRDPARNSIPLYESTGRGFAAAKAAAIASQLANEANEEQRRAKVGVSTAPLQRPLTATRPLTTTRPMSPSGVEYERAYRQWSVPPGVPDPEAADGGPLSFQVYTPEDIGAGRGPMRTVLPLHVEPERSNVALRVGLGACAAVMTLLTVLAVIVGVSEEPRAPRAATTTSVAAELPPAPPPSTIVIGDDALPVTAAAAPAAVVVQPPDDRPLPPAAPAAHPRPKKPKAASSTTPASGGVLGNSGTLKPPYAPPPNPYK